MPWGSGSRRCGGSDGICEGGSFRVDEGYVFGIDDITSLDFENAYLLAPLAVDTKSQSLLD